MRLAIFKKEADYAAFEGVLAESLGRVDAPRLLAYCLMPSHWHLVVQAGRRTNLSTWMQWLTVTHTHRWHVHHHTTGEGPLYQGRFKSFPVQDDAHFLTVCRYVEANAVRSGLVDHAEDWRWGSLWARRKTGAPVKCWLGEWPVERPPNWLAEVDRLLDDEALSAVRQAIARGTPFGEERWQARVASRLGLSLTMRPRGRPPKQANNSS